MRHFGWITLGLIFMLFFTIFAAQQNNTSLEHIQSNFSMLQNLTDNITQNTIIYVNPYKTNFTGKEAIMNTVHIIFYAGLQEMNTLIGFTTNLIYNHLTINGFNTIKKTLLIVFLTWIFFKLFKPIAIIYVLIIEAIDKRRKKNEKRNM